MLGFIVQARSGSTRFPGKVLKRIYDGKTVLEVIIEQLKKFNIKIIVATTTSSLDDEIIKVALKQQVDYFRGDQFNVLKRYIDCAQKFNLSQIIRICSDNIFIQPKLLIPYINEKNMELDYISYEIKGKNSILTHWGFFGEYVSLNALKKVQSLTNDKVYLEHVTNYIYHHPQQFNIKYKVVPQILNREDIRLTIDTRQDFEICKEIVNYLISNNLDWNYPEILKYINKNPKILERMRININQNIKN